MEAGGDWTEAEGALESVAEESVPDSWKMQQKKKVKSRTHTVLPFLL